MKDAGIELVFDDDSTLNWATVYEASGVGEPRTYTRRKTRKRNEPASGVSFSVTAEVRQSSKKGPGATSTSKGKEKVVEDDEELEYEEGSQESEEE